MDLLYQQPSLKVSLGFTLVHLEIMKKYPSTLSTNDGKAKAYLSSFCDFAGEKNKNNLKWDHGLLLTGIDLHEEGIHTTAGEFYLTWGMKGMLKFYIS